MEETGSRVGLSLRNQWLRICEAYRQEKWRGVTELCLSRDAPGLIQFAKYGFCGVCSVILHNAVVALLVLTVLPTSGDGLSAEELRRNLVVANLIAFPVGNVFTYAVNSWLVFTPGRHSRLREFLLFTGLSLFSFSIGLFGGPIFFGEGSSVVLAQLGFTVTSALVNFLCRKFLIFLK